MSKKNIMIILITIGIIALIYCIHLIIMNKLLIMDLVGDEVITLNYPLKYNDEGVLVSFRGKNLTSKVIIKDNINYHSIGEYTITYRINYLFFSKKINRIIKIIDVEKPTITLKGDNPLYLSINETYKEEGYIVNDNYDKKPTVDIIGKVNTKKQGEYNITYQVRDSSQNINAVIRKVIVSKKVIVENGITYVNDILVVNKKYGLPSTFTGVENHDALNSLKLLQNNAEKQGLSLKLLSGYRSYNYQKTLYNNYVKKHGKKIADTFSAMPGHSEHQTGLAFDVGKIDDKFNETPSGKWLAENAHYYGFIIRYPEGKQHITGYKYEPWHIRYLGVEVATKVYESGLCLEEYLKI